MANDTKSGTKTPKGSSAQKNPKIPPKGRPEYVERGL